MVFTLGKFSFDKTTVVSLVVVIALLGVGYGVGHVVGTKSVQNDIIEQGAQQQSLTGTVKSTNKDGFTVEIGPVAGNTGSGSAGPDGKTPSGTWTVKYSAQGANVSLSSGSGSGNEEQQLKEGDEVQVSGTQIGKNLLVAQSVTKVVPPTPEPSAAPKPQ